MRSLLTINVLLLSRSGDEVQIRMSAARRERTAANLRLRWR
jgi:hypothetical protein